MKRSSINFPGLLAEAALLALTLFAAIVLIGVGNAVATEGEQPRSRPNIAVGDLNGDGLEQKEQKLLLRPALKPVPGAAKAPDLPREPGTRPGLALGKPVHAGDAGAKPKPDEKKLTGSPEKQQALLLPAVQKVREAAAPAAPAKPVDLQASKPPVQAGLLLPAVQKVADPAALPPATTMPVAPTKVPTLTVQPATAMTR
jgi:hypothetical protein